MNNILTDSNGSTVEVEGEHFVFTSFNGEKYRLAMWPTTLAVWPVFAGERVMAKKYTSVGIILTLAEAREDDWDASD